ncbi:hypothetical protein [Brevundimonas sp. DC300-4]
MERLLLILALVALLAWTLHLGIELVRVSVRSRPPFNRTGV